MKLLVAFVITASVLLFAGVNCKGERIGLAMLHEDPKLAQCVSTSLSDVTIAHLLETWSKQTGVKIDIDPRDTASGYSLLVEADHIPVARMMDALYRLVSSTKAEWAWNRYGKPGDYSYELVETALAKNRTERYRQLQIGLLRNLIAKTREMVKLTPEERIRRRNELDNTLLMESSSKLDWLYQNDSTHWTEAKLFFETTTPQQQETIMNGGSISIETKSLSPAAYETFKSDYENKNPEYERPDGIIGRNPAPTHITYMCLSADPKRFRLGPVIVGGDMSVLGSGWFEFGIRLQLEKQWFLSGDSKQDPSENRTVAKTTETEEERANRLDREKRQTEIADALGGRQRSLLLADLSKPLYNVALRQVARGASIPIMAILPPGAVSPPLVDPVGKTVAGYLSAIHDQQFSVFYKWHDGLLMLSHPFWFAIQDPVVPQVLIANLSRDSKGNVRISDFMSLMGHISPQQAEWFCSQYHVGDYKQVEPMIHLAIENPGVINEGGIAVAISDASRVLGNRLLIADSGTARREALLFRLRLVSERDLSRLDVQYFDPTRKRWQTSSGAYLSLKIQEL